MSLNNPLTHSQKATWGLYGQLSGCISFWVVDRSRDYRGKWGWKRVQFWEQADFSEDAWDNYSIDYVSLIDRADIPEMKIMVKDCYHEF